jgi:branched-chain amino acid transport system substrate-binding protein
MGPPPDAISELTGFIGGACSSGCVYSEGLLFRSKTTMIASGCTSASVVQQGYPTVFRISWNDGDQAIVAAKYLRGHLGAKRVAVVIDSTSYSRSLASAFRTQIRADGGSVANVQIPQTGSTNVTAIASGVRSSGAEGVFFAVGRPDSSDIFANLQSSLAPLSIVASDSVLSRDGPGIHSGLIAVGLARVNGDWHSEMDEGPYSTQLFSNQTLDAERLYLMAMNKVAVRQSDGTLVIARRALRDAIKNANVGGQTGLLSFSGQGERLHDVGAELDQIEPGKATVVLQYKR